MSLGPQRAPVLAMKDPVADFVGDRARQAQARGIARGRERVAFAASLLVAAVAFFGFRRLADRQGLPQFDPSGMLAAERQVRRLVARKAHQPGTAAFDPVIDEIEHRGRRAKAGGQIDTA